jgi:hypothetical protein
MRTGEMELVFDPLPFPRDVTDARLRGHVVSPERPV